MKKLMASMITGLLAVSALPDAAAAQSACEMYRIQRGDTMREIARNAYGTDDFGAIYDANATQIGRNPNVIEVGVVLRLPCIDGSLPEGAEPPLRQGTGNDPDIASFVTANGYLPYTDESLPGRGLFTQLVETAMLRAAPKQKREVIFVNDWASHLEVLLPTLAFDASFPWTRPGCESQSNLTQIERYSCEHYIYSDPFYEIVDGFFSLNDGKYEAVSRFADLQGATICRPEGYPTGHLEEHGLMPPATKLVRPINANECFDQLMSGYVDMVALDTRSGDRSIAELGLTHEVAANPNLSMVMPLQVAVHRSNPGSEALIETLNKGLKTMLETGEWHDIVADGLRLDAEVYMN